MTTLRKHAALLGLAASFILQTAALSYNLGKLNQQVDDLKTNVSELRQDMRDLQTGRRIQ